MQSIYTYNSLIRFFPLFRNTLLHILLGIGLMLSGISSRADIIQLDRIIAVVDDDVILASELENRMKLIKQRFNQNNNTLPAEDILNRQVLERLIVDSVQLQMAERVGVRISDDELTSAIIQFAQQSNLTLDQLLDDLKSQGIDYKHYRNQIRNDILIQQVQRNFVQRRIYITPNEVKDFLASPTGQQSTSDEYHVGHILIAVPSDASEKTIAKLQSKAESLSESLNNGATFEEVAVAHSNDSRALEGGDLGWRKINELPSLIADNILTLKIGKVTEPIKSSSGFHIVGLFAKRGRVANMQAIEQADVRHILVRTSEIRTVEQSKELIHKIRGLILDGADFGKLAQKYSQDPGSAVVDGELGWIIADTMAPEFAEMVRKLPVSELSQPFKTQFGWHILEVKGRREQDMSKEFLEQEAIRQIRNSRYEDELQNFLNEIRSNAYVDIRL